MDLIIFQYHLSFKGHVSRAPRARRPTQGKSMSHVSRFKDTKEIKMLGFFP